MSGRKRISKSKGKIVYQQSEGHCIYCGKISTQYHIDHVVPYTIFKWTGEENKANDIRNLYLSCEYCNLEKGSTLMTYQELSKIKVCKKQRHQLFVYILSVLPVIFRYKNMIWFTAKNQKYRCPLCRGYLRVKQCVPITYKGRIAVKHVRCRD